MAQIISTVCDQHLHADDLEIPGETYEVSLALPGAKAQQWHVDLCTDCAKGLLVLNEFLLELGRAPAKAPRQPKAKRSAAAATTVAAPTTTKAAAPASNGGAVAPMAELLADLVDVDGGWHCPVDGCGLESVSQHGLEDHCKRAHGKRLSVLMGLPLDHTCPDCGEGFTTPQGLGSHRNRSHGVKGSSKGAKAATSSAS